MPLSNTELRYFDANIVRLPGDKRREYHAQVDRLIAELSKTLPGKATITITAVVKAGSFAKHTILRKTNDDPVDVDVVFYVKALKPDQETLAALTDDIYALLTDIYPTKSVEDFELQRKAAKITFVGSGLSVDIVPVIQDPKRPDYGWQYDTKDGTRIQTCAPCQIKFVSDRKKKDPDFRTLVRLAKKWRNYADDVPLKSFHVELIMAHLLAKDGTGATLERRFCDFLRYLAQSELKEIISFPENTLPHGVFDDPVVILDPVCSDNNVASRITECERQAIVSAAEKAWETAHFASMEDDHEVWKEIFGPRFRTTD